MPPIFAALYFLEVSVILLALIGVSQSPLGRFVLPDVTTARQ